MSDKPPIIVIEVLLLMLAMRALWSQGAPMLTIEYDIFIVIYVMKLFFPFDIYSCK